MATTPKPKSDFANIRVATISGIPIFIHWTFILFIAWIALVKHSSDPKGLLFVLAVFVCVLLHELGHAFAARQFHIKTASITLYPIGGVALIESQPRAWKELWVAIAGPLVNVVIASALYVGLRLKGVPIHPLVATLTEGSLIENLIYINISLFLFNLIPAFPMDGGRILRSLLEVRFGREIATNLAAKLGQGIGIFFLLGGLYSWQPIIMLIGGFVLFTAGAEINELKSESMLSGRKVIEATVSQFQTLPAASTLDDAAAMLLEGSQHDFPVEFNSEVIGVLRREDLARGLVQSGVGAPIGDFITRNFVRLAAHDDLESAVEAIRANPRIPILVFDGEKLLGMVTSENLNEFFLVETARKHRRNTAS